MIALAAFALFSLCTVIHGQTCPPGQIPYSPNGVAVPCTQTAGATACNGVPEVYCQSVPSNPVNFQFLCCQNLAGTCPSPLFPYLLPPTNTPVPCTPGMANNCPPSALCLNQPTNVVQLQNLCCTNVPAVTTTTTTISPFFTTTTTISPFFTTTLATTTTAVGGLNPGPGGTLSSARCANTNERPLFETGTTYYRNCAIKACPTTHHCEYDTLNKVFACCGPPSTTSASDCAVGNILMYPATGSPVVCPNAGSTTQCPTSNQYCMYSASYGYNVCCSTSSSTGTTTSSTSDCAVGSVLLYPQTGSPVVCPTAGSTTQCPTSYQYCLYSARYGYNVCCTTSGSSSTTSSTECPASGIYMYPASAYYPSTPLVCPTAGSTTQCPASNKYCVYSTSYGYNICCSTLNGSSGTTTSTDCSSTDVLMSGGVAAVCTVIGVGQCPSTYAYCAYSSSRRQNVCCRTSIGK